MDAFFCITLGTLILYFWIKWRKEDKPARKISDEELITTVIPTINDKK